MAPSELDWISGLQDTKMNMKLLDLDIHTVLKQKSRGGALHVRDVQSCLIDFQRQDVKMLVFVYSNLPSESC